MSDGMYFFEGSSEKSKAFGKVKINQGKFSGENLEYLYTGYFLIEKDILHVNANLKNKSTEKENKFDCSTNFENDKHVTFSAEIEGEKFSFVLKKEEGSNTTSW
jgi:hypothetical protein